MTFYATLIALAIGGMVDTAYLMWRHRRHTYEPMVCPLNHNCAAVTESKWSTIFGVRNDTLGFLFYFGIFVGALSVIIMPIYSEIVLNAMFWASAAAILASAGLVFIQWKILRDYCFYCMISAIINVFIFINTYSLWLHR